MPLKLYEEIMSQLQTNTMTIDKFMDDVKIMKSDKVSKEQKNKMLIQF
jgi:glycyl-tRNA synthetase beta subunit